MRRELGQLSLPDDLVEGGAERLRGRRPPRLRSPRRSDARGGVHTSAPGSSRCHLLVPTRQRNKLRTDSKLPGAAGKHS